MKTKLFIPACEENYENNECQCIRKRCCLYNEYENNACRVDYLNNNSGPIGKKV